MNPLIVDLMVADFNFVVCLYIQRERGWQNEVKHTQQTVHIVHTVRNTNLQYVLMYVQYTNIRNFYW